MSPASPASPKARKRKLSDSQPADEERIVQRTKAAKEGADDGLDVRKHLARPSRRSVSDDDDDDSHSGPSSPSHSEESNEAVSPVETRDREDADSEVHDDHSEDDTPAAESGTDAPRPGSHSGSEPSPESGSDSDLSPDEASAPEHPAKLDSPPRPPLPNEPIPLEQPPNSNTADGDDGWEPVWDPRVQAFYFYNRLTQATQWENPRIPNADTTTAENNNDDNNNDGSKTGPVANPSGGPPLPPEPPTRAPVAGGYNPAIHGDYDPDADYAIAARVAEEEAQAAADGVQAQLLLQQQQKQQQQQLPPGQRLGTTTLANAYAATGRFNRVTGEWQDRSIEDGGVVAGPGVSAKPATQWLDLDAVASEHDGRSLKAERAGKRLSKDEVKMYRQRREERKKEKQRAWLRS